MLLGRSGRSRRYLSLFSLIMLLGWGMVEAAESPSGKQPEKQAPSREPSAENTAPNNVGEFPPFIFIPFDQTVPLSVLKTKEESLAAIKVTLNRIYDDQEVYSDVYRGVGVVVGSKYILTCLHLFGPYPALWVTTPPPFEIVRSN